MPAIIRGPVQIDVVGVNGIVKFGDSFVLTPKGVSKTYVGSGAFNTGFSAITNNGISSTNFIKPSVIDQPISGNH